MRNHSHDSMSSESLIVSAKSPWSSSAWELLALWLLFQIQLPVHLLSI